MNYLSNLTDNSLGLDLNFYTNCEIAEMTKYRPKSDDFKIPVSQSHSET